MIKRFKVFLLALVTFSMVLNISPIHGEVNEEPPTSVVGTDKTYLFFNDKGSTDNLIFSLTQDGNDIPDGGEIDITKDLKLEFDIKIPVEGDFYNVEGEEEPEKPDPSEYVSHNDYIKIPISKDFTVKSDSIFILTTEDGTEVGTAHVLTEDGFTYAYVHFDKDADPFDGNNNNVTAKFNIDLKYNGDGNLGEGGSNTTTIVDKDFTLTKPGLKADYSIAKTGAITDKKTGEITWTVTLEGTLGGKDLDFEGFIFSDDLSNAGEYVPGSFEVNTTPATPKYVKEGNKQTIEYTMPKGSISEQVITYKTKISNEKYFGDKVVVKTNSAMIKEDEHSFKKTGTSVTHTPKWIKKSGEGSYKDGVYDPANQTITWTILINEVGATLDNVVVTDKLDENLVFQNAVAYVGLEGSVEHKNLVIDKVNNTYSLGNITGPIRLVIETKVKNKDYEFEKGEISNNASVTWDGMDGSHNDGANVGIGFNAITKSGTVNEENQTVNWQVIVDKRGQKNFPENLKVFDLIIHGAEKPNMVKPDGISEAMFENLLTTPSLNQRYIEGTFASDDNLHLEVIKVYSDADSKNHVADLLIVSGEGTKKDKFTFNFDTYIVNPDITLGNKTSTLSNKAFLYSGETSLGDATADKEYKNKLISKKVIDRKSHNLIPKTEAANDVNNANGYNYIDHSVVYRLDVNIDGINISDIENANGESMGKVTVVDTLPKDWSITHIIAEKDYLIYKYENGKAIGEPLDLDILSYKVDEIFDKDGKKQSTITFTFEELKEGYVILIKAKPGEKLIKDYFGKNGETTETNTLNLKTEHWELKEPVKETIKIKSEILGKDATRTENGVAEWSVVYNPYYNVGLFPETMRLIDTLPEGIELQRDSKGVIKEGTIRLFEYKIKIDGTLELVNEVLDYKIPHDAYNPDTRELTLVIPDSTKAYKFTYITDVTANAGEISNKVVLEGEEKYEIESEKKFEVKKEDSSASMQRLGSLLINKKSNNGETLQGVVFTLFDKDENIVIRRSKTNDKGVAHIRALAPGEYVLKETTSLDGYKDNEFTYNVKVYLEGKKMITEVNGQVLDNGLNVINYTDKTHGSLKITKKISGNAASKNDEFKFNIKFENQVDENAKFEYINSEDKIVREFVNGSTLTLKTDETITIVGIPKDTTYTVTEIVENGYKLLKVIGDEGTIIADETSEAEFLNFKENSVTLTKKNGHNEEIHDDLVRFSLFKLVNGVYEPVTNAQNLPLTDGKIVWKGLDIGFYKFKEVKTSDDYILNTQELEFEVTASDKDIEVADDIALDFINYQGEVLLIKKGKSTVDGALEPLKDVVFELYKGGEVENGVVIKPGELVNTDPLVTNEEGKITVERLSPGEYYFKEISNPNGHVLDTRVTTFTVASEHNGELLLIETEVENSMASVQMKKVGLDEKPLSGAEFEIRLEGSTDVEPYARAISDEDGIVKFDGLKVGSYEIRETKAADGYIRNTDVIKHTVESTTDKDLKTIELSDFVNYKGSASITKKDKDNKALEGAVFSLYKEDITDILIDDQVTTNKDGYALVSDLVPGDYYFIETKAPDGYIRSTEKFKFTIASEAIDVPAVVNVDVVNYKGSASLIKTDEKGNRLEDSIFELSLITGSETKVIQKISDAEGLVQFDDLDVGHYSVTEKEATTGYIRNEDVYKFEIKESSADGKIHIDLGKFINYKGSVELVKLDENNEVLEGVVFEFYLDGAEEKAQYTTDKDGKILVTDLAPGKYYFKEVSTPHGHIINTTPIEVVIAESHLGKLQMIKTSATNAYAKAEFKKVGEDDNALSGVEFELYLNKAIYGRTTSGENGLVSFDGLVAGNYVVREVKSKTDYLLNTEEIEFRVEEYSDSVKKEIKLDDYVNYQGSVSLFKLDNHSEALENVKFDLYKEVINEDGDIHNILIDNDYITNDKGLIKVDKLSPGKYYFLETETVDGHILYTGKIPFVIAESAEGIPADVFVSLVNKKGSVEFNKVDVDGNLLEGAEFELYLGKSIYDKTVSDENGLVEFKDLIPGKYLVKETIAADGYVLNTKEFEFEINETTDQEEVHLILDDYTNYKGDVLLNKVDENNDKLEGVIFNLYNETDELVFENLETDENGQLIVENLAVGLYYFKEVSSVDGNLVNTEKHYFNITEFALDKPEDVVLTVTNSKGLVEFTKVDEDGNPLEGAKFELYIKTETGLQLFATVDSDKDGYVYVDGLIAGDYIFKEVEAVDGYILNTREVEFVIDAEADVEKVVVTLDDFVNYQGKVILNKVNRDKELLFGAKFELLNSDLEVIKEIRLTKGTTEISNLAPGSYFLREIEAPRDYLLSEDLYAFTIDASALDEPEIEVINFLNISQFESVLGEDNFDDGESVLGEDNIPTGVQNNVGYLFLLLALSAFVVLINSKTFVRKVKSKK